MRLLHPWNFPGKSTEWVGHFLFQGTFPTQGIEPRSPALQADTFTSEPPGNLLVTTTLNHKYFFYVEMLAHLGIILIFKSCFRSFCLLNLYTVSQSFLLFHFFIVRSVKLRMKVRNNYHSVCIL